MGNRPLFILLFLFALSVFCCVGLIEQQVSSVEEKKQSSSYLVILVRCHGSTARLQVFTSLPIKYHQSVVTSHQMSPSPCTALNVCGDF